MRSFGITTVAALLLAAAPCVALTQAAAPAAPATASALPDLQTQDLLQRLNSTNPAERQAAQKQLAAIADMLRQPEFLQKLSDVSTDPGLKSFFQSRLAQLKSQEEEKLAANLPPISLSVKNASLTDVVDALNQALNTSSKLQYITNAAASTGIYTLDVKDKPFWEVYTALSQQQPLNISNSTITGLRITGSTIGVVGAGGRAGINNGGNRPFVIDGPAIAFLNSVSLQRSVNLQSTDAPQSSLTLSLAVFSDPRLRVSRVKYPTLTLAQDDQGHPLTSTLITPINTFTTAAIMNRSFTLNAPANLGKSVSFTYESAFEIATGSTLATIDDVQNSLNKPVTVGDRSVTVSRFTNSPTGTSASISVSSTPSPAATPAGLTTTPAVTYTLLDATGRSVWNFTGTGSIGSSFSTTATTPPYKLEIRVATNTIQIPVRFQFKDIPLP